MFLQDNILALVTPYLNGDGDIDFESFNRYVNYVNSRTPFNRLLILGSTGDQQAITLENKKEIITKLVSENIDTKFLIGVSHTSTNQVRELVNHFKTINCSHPIMLGIPPYILPNQQEIMHYVSQIANQFESNILLYNNPKRTGVNIDASSINYLMQSNSNILAVKGLGTNRFSEIFTKNIYTGSDISMLTDNYYDCTSVIGSILPYTAYYFNKKKTSLEHNFISKEYSDIVNTITPIGLVKSIKYILYKMEILKNYSTIEPMLPVTKDEQIVIDNLYPRILELENISRKFNLE